MIKSYQIVISEDEKILLEQAIREYCKENCDIDSPSLTVRKDNINKCKECNAHLMRVIYTKVRDCDEMQKLFSH